MCGIVGYTGPREAGPILIEGLKRLEYRGYDSAGIALVDDAGDLFVEKRAGKLVNLQTAIADRTPHAAIGLAHTRWATHGRPNDLNAHPHRDCTGEITVIHNGIIENFRELRDGLEARGHTLTSRDRHRGDRPPRRGGLPTATSPTPCATRSRRLEGAYAIVVMHIGEGDRLVGARKDVPLVVGLGDGESFLASRRRGDPGPHRPDRLPRGRRRGGPPTLGRDHHRRRRRAARARRCTTIDWTPEAAEKGGYEHFMLKEIHEQPESLSQCHRRPDRPRRPDRASTSWPGSRRSCGRSTRIELIACGSAYYAALVGAAALQDWTGIPARANSRLRVPLQPAAARRADAGHRRHPVGRDRRHDRPDPAGPRARLPGHRGHQHGRLGHHPRGRRGPLPAGRPGDRGRRVEDVRHPGHDPGHPGRGHRQGARRRCPRPTELALGPRCGRCPAAAARALAAAAVTTPELARRYVNSRGFMFVGRGATYPVALEGALKLKEVSYVHAEGYAAGELKHGPISLLDAECPLVAVATRSAVYDKLISNVMEGRARDARVIAVATEGDEAIERLRRRHLLGPRHPRGAQPGPGDHPAPAVRLPHRRRAGHGRRPAAQPGQVGHGRVATPMAGRPRSAPGTTELGIDIIKVDRIRASLERFGPRFSKRVLTEAEQRYVRGRPETMAGRWAAKEAVSKVLGLGVRGIGWRDIEIERMPTGQPAVRLHGRAAARAEQLGMERIAVSITPRIRLRGRDRVRGPDRRRPVSSSRPTSRTASTSASG